MVNIRELAFWSKHFFPIIPRMKLVFFCFIVIVLMPFYGHLLRWFGFPFNLLIWYIKIPVCSLNDFTWTWTIVILIQTWSEITSILFGILIGLFIACHFLFLWHLCQAGGSELCWLCVSIGGASYNLLLSSTAGQYAIRSRAEESKSPQTPDLASLGDNTVQSFIFPSRLFMLDHRLILQ